MQIWYNTVKMSDSRVLSGIIQVITTLVELLLSLRIVLKLFGANPITPFTQWIYETTEPLLTPFSGMFPSPALEGVFVIEFSTLFALIVYLLAGNLLLELVRRIELSNQTRSQGSKKN